MTTQVRIHSYQERDMSDSLTIVGFPSVGMVGSITGSFLVKTLKMEVMGALLHDDYPPVAVIRDGQAQPAVRIYGGERVCEPGGVCSQVGVVTSELPLSSSMAHQTARAILEFCRHNKSRQIVTIEGINAAEEPEDDTVYGVGSSSKMKKMLKRLKVEPIENGMVGGLSGALLAEGSLANFDVMCLLGEVFAENIPDARAAARVVGVLAKMLPELSLDPKPLLEEAQKIEEFIKSQITSSTPTEVPAQIKPPSPFMYG